MGYKTGQSANEVVWQTLNVVESVSNRIRRSHLRWYQKWAKWFLVEWEQPESEEEEEEEDLETAELTVCRGR